MRWLSGFVDAHTHAVFDGDRSHEMAMKLAGTAHCVFKQRWGWVHHKVATVEMPDVFLLAMLVRACLCVCVCVIRGHVHGCVQGRGWH